MQQPKDLKAEGRKLWQTIVSGYELAGCEELLRELCRISDRLHDIRVQIAADGLMPEGKAHPLLAAEAKLSGQFRMIWRTLGLADDDEPKRRPGRPSVGG